MGLARRNNAKAGRAVGWAAGLTGGLVLDDLWHHALLGTILSVAAVGASVVAGWRVRGRKS